MTTLTTCDIEQIRLLLPRQQMYQVRYTLNGVSRVSYDGPDWKKAHDHAEWCSRANLQPVGFRPYTR